MEQKEINIDKLVAGDERAFIAFIEYHSSALYHYAFNILHQKECAEEVYIFRSIPVHFPAAY